MRKLAIKRLTASDLTFLEWHFRNLDAGNQKSINLNADVFVNKLYPALPAVALQQDGVFLISLDIHGPGLAKRHTLARKIIKHGTYKNWRLDGEFVHDPEGQPERFNPLQPGDYAIFEFLGSVAPSGAKLIFVAASVAEDEALHAELGKILGQKSMQAVSLSELEGAVEKANPDEEHPIHELTIDDALEDAAQGGSEGVKKLLKRPSQKLSKGELEQARQKAAQLGRLGEELLDSHLAKLHAESQIDSYVWASDSNAVSPFDFRVQAGSSSFVLDAKSTAYDFSRPIHVSESELREMSLGEDRYDLYRLYEVEPQSAKLRVAEDMRAVAAGILDVLGQLPEGVRADGVSISPSVLSFGPEVTIVPPETGDD